MRTYQRWKSDAKCMKTLPLSDNQYCQVTFSDKLSNAEKKFKKYSKFRNLIEAKNYFKKKGGCYES